MDKKNRINIPGYIVLLFLGLLCIVILFYSFATGFSGGILGVAADYVFTPMQEGLSNAGSAISHTVDSHREKEKLMAENERLTKRVNELESRLTRLPEHASLLKALVTGLRPLLLIKAVLTVSKKT